MAFNLQLLETEIPEDLLEETESRSADYTMAEITEVEKNLWVASVFDGFRSHEVEVLVKGSLITSYTCDCRRAKKKEPCTHLVFASYKLRDILLSRDIDKQAKELKSQKSDIKRGLTLQRIFHEIPSADVAQFLRLLSSNNPRLSRQIKLHFAHRIPSADNESKYRNLLNEFGGKPFANNREFSPRQATEFLGAIRHFLDLLPVMIAEQNYREAIDILKTLPYYLVKGAKLNPDESQFSNLLDAWHRQVRSILKENLAPSLMQEFHDYCLSFYRNEQIQIETTDSLFEILVDHAPAKSQLNNFLRIAADRLNDISSKIRFLKAVIKSGEWSDAIRFTNENLSKSNQRSQAIEMVAKSYPDLLDQFIIGLLKNQDFKDQKKVLKKVSLEETPDLSADVGNILISSAAESQDIFFIELIEGWFPKRKTQMLITLAGEIALENPEALILGTIFSRVNDLEQLVIWLKSRNLDDLMTFGEPHIVYNQQIFQPLFIDKLENYLSTHIGPKARLKAEEVLTFLQRIEALDLKKVVERFFKTKYPQRNLLQKEPEEL